MKRSKNPVGRPPVSGVTLTPQQVRATVSALFHLKSTESFRDEDILVALSDFGEDQTEESLAPFSIDEVAFTADPSTIYRIVKSTPGGKSPIIKGLYLWISRTHATLFHDYEREEFLSREEPEISSLKRLFGYHSPLFRIESLEEWRGDFKIFRPNPNNIHQILMNAFKVGSEASDFDCTLESVVLNTLGRPMENTALGKITSHRSGTAFAILNIVDAEYKPGHSPKGNYTFHFHDVQHHRGLVSSFRGIIVASVGDLPSAWPFAGARADDSEAITPHILTPDEQAALPDGVIQQLRLGGVHWSKEQAEEALKNPAP